MPVGTAKCRLLTFASRMRPVCNWGTVEKALAAAGRVAGTAAQTVLLSVSEARLAALAALPSALAGRGVATAAPPAVSAEPCAEIEGPLAALAA